jgi:hypothetical protein
MAGNVTDGRQLSKFLKTLELYCDLDPLRVSLSRRTIRHTKDGNDGITYPEYEHPGTYAHVELVPSEEMAKTWKAISLDMNVWGGYGVEVGSDHHHQGNDRTHQRINDVSGEIIAAPTKVTVAVRVTDTRGKESHILNLRFQLNKTKNIVVESAMLGDKEDPEWSLSPSVVIEGHPSQTFDHSDPRTEVKNKIANQQNFKSLKQSLLVLQRKGVQLTPRE